MPTRIRLRPATLGAAPTRVTPHLKRLNPTLYLTPIEKQYDEKRGDIREKDRGRLDFREYVDDVIAGRNERERQRLARKRQRQKKRPARKSRNPERWNNDKSKDTHGGTC